MTVLGKCMSALVLAFWACSPASAAPAKSITFAMGTGAINPPGAVPFDQWITATSAAPVVLAEGENIAPTAVLEHCEGSPSACKPGSGTLPTCKFPDLPVTATCSLPVTATLSDDKKGYVVRVDIPPLRYNRVYRLKLTLVGKTEVPLAAISLHAVDGIIDQWIGQLADANGSEPTATEICESLVEAITTGFPKKDVRVDGALKDCAEGAAKPDQINAMELRIENAVNSRTELVEAREDQAKAMRASASGNGNGGGSGINLADANEAVDTAEKKDNKARLALRGPIKQVVQNNTWMPIPLGTAADAKTARMSHISMDAGLVYGWDLDETTTYVGANIYTRPINTDVSLAALKSEGMLTWRHRFSFTLGATVSSIEKAGQRKGIVGSSALVVGAGWRLTDVMRLSAGVLVFKEENPNPLVTNDTSLAASPYVGFSFDIDVAKQFGKVFSGLP